LESQLAIKNTDNAAALALSLSQSNPDPVMADLVVASLFDSGHYELIRITDPKGNLITERTAPAGDLDAPGWFVKALPLEASAGIAQISSGWKQFGAVTLVSHSRFAYGALWKSAYEMVFALSLAGLVGGFLGALVLRRLRRPLDAVIDQAQAITQRRFVSIELPAVPELRQLAVAMNATVRRLKAMFEEEAARLEMVRREANFDPLTGLANRSHFMARLRQSLESEDSLGGALLLIRLADLVGINRRLGRVATDDFLRQVGGVIDAWAAQSPFNVAARLNGADFAVLMGHEGDARMAADDLLAALVEVSTPFIESDAIGWIGVGRFKQGADMGALLARVDVALAGVEAHGANAVREAPTDEDDEMPRTAEQWSVMIRRALKHGWVRLISFPVVDGLGKLSHRECPLRLRFDEKGEWLPAGRFLPVAERLKLTPALDLAAVALGLKELQGQPHLQGLAVNLSASSVGDAGFRQDLIALLANRKELTSRLWLEVAEAGALKHLTEFRELCRSLKSVGCRVGLEHYGHQFSQIGVLHDMGLDYLKVDPSFVRGVDSNAGNVAFLNGLCSIAHNIGLLVLAEGVATQAELTALIQLGFDGATGPAVKEEV
jgi:predicted signal transduction protein with EAL and GGDEF domain